MRERVRDFRGPVRSDFVAAQCEPGESFVAAHCVGQCARAAGSDLVVAQVERVELLKAIQHLGEAACSWRPNVITAQIEPRERLTCGDRAGDSVTPGSTEPVAAKIQTVQTRVRCQLFHDLDTAAGAHTLPVQVDRSFLPHLSLRFDTLPRAVTARWRLAVIPTSDDGSPSTRAMRGDALVLNHDQVRELRVSHSAGRGGRVSRCCPAFSFEVRRLW